MPILKGTGRMAQQGGGGGGDSSRPPDRILFVEEMTEIFCVTLPDLWKLGQAYLKGSLFQGVALLTENQKKLAENCEINKSRFEVSRDLQMSDVLVDTLVNSEMVGRVMMLNITQR